MDERRYAALLKDYQKLFRTTLRLMRLTDRNERELNALADKQRKANEHIAQKNKELEALVHQALEISVTAGLRLDLHGRAGCRDRLSAQEAHDLLLGRGRTSRRPRTSSNRRI